MSNDSGSVAKFANAPNVKWGRGESAALTGLAEKLEVPERRRAYAEKRAAEVAPLPEGDRPARYDLAKLRSLL
jgi:hypothetical protein